MSRAWYLSAAVALAFVLRCTSNGPVAGGTTDTGNAVTATVVMRNGAPAANATVHLRLSDFVAQLPTLAKTTIYGADALTDDSGRFVISGINPGIYRIEINEPFSESGAGGAVLFTCSINKNDTVNLGVDTLRSFAAITGMADTHSRATDQLYVQIAGLQRLVSVGASGRYTISDIPAGTFDIRTVVARASGVTVVRHDSVHAVSGDTAIAPSPLPAPWFQTAIGETPRGGAFYFNGTWTIAGGGSDIWNTADGFHFVYQPWIGDGEIIAHVTSFDYGREYFSKAGVQFRASLDPSAQNVGLSLDIDNLGRYLAALHFRNIQGDSSSVKSGLDSVLAPQWVRMVRTADVFTGLVSRDGIAWDTVGTDTMAMNADVYVGMAVTSHDTTGLSTAVFESLTVR